MNQHYNLDDMDFGELAAKMKLIAIDEMRHAEMFAERVKELGGEPVTGHDGKIAKGQAVQGMYPFDAKLEDDTIDVYNQFALVCRENGDSISMKIFEDIIDEEQIHFNYFDNVDGHIKKLGDTYLAKIAGTPSSTGLGPSGFAVSGEGASLSITTNGVRPYYVTTPNQVHGLIADRVNWVFKDAGIPFVWRKTPAKRHLKLFGTTNNAPVPWGGIKHLKGKRSAISPCPFSWTARPWPLRGRIMTRFAPAKRWPGHFPIAVCGSCAKMATLTVNLLMTLSSNLRRGRWSRRPRTSAWSK
jgi:bacterioferritin